jgi:hypothetical protein
MTGSVWTENTVLHTLLRVVAEDLGEELFYQINQSVLGLVLQGGLQFALGSVGFGVSIAGLIAWMARIGFRASIEVEWAQATGTQFKMNTTRAGLVVLQNTEPAALRHFVLPLPEVAEITREELFPAHAMAQARLPIGFPSFYRIDARSVLESPCFHILTCDECHQPATRHVPGCSENPQRPKPIQNPGLSNYLFHWAGESSSAQPA